jgi:uncharacterized metal-binding protein YceD (DUF177 family)
MLKVHIQSLPDDGREFELTEQADKLEKLFDEFVGNVEVVGKVKISGDRFTITGKAFGTAALECDLSLEEYEEKIEAEFSLTALKSNYGQTDESEADTLYISEEDTYIDISEIVAESLSIALPMKRIAPAYKGKQLKDIHPDREADTTKKEKTQNPSDTWAALKNIKLN